MSPDWAAKAEPVPYAKISYPQSLNLYTYTLNNPLGSWSQILLNITVVATLVALCRGAIRMAIGIYIAHLVRTAAPAYWF